MALREQSVFTKEGAIINFVYFLYNFKPGIYDVIDLVFAEKHGQVFADHVKSKLRSHQKDDNVVRAEYILGMFMDLNTTYQSEFVKWVTENYYMGLSEY
jgi:hypothetical protein